MNVFYLFCVVILCGSCVSNKKCSEQPPTFSLIGYRKDDWDVPLLPITAEELLLKKINADRIIRLHQVYFYQGGPEHLAILAVSGRFLGYFEGHHSFILIKPASERDWSESTVYMWSQTRCVRYKNDRGEEVEVDLASPSSWGNVPDNVLTNGLQTFKEWDAKMRKGRGVRVPAEVNR